jgi:O-antigen ligase
MNTPDTLKNMPIGLTPGARSRRIPGGGVVLVAICFAIGILGVLFPLVALGCFVAVAVLALVWLALRYLSRSDLEFWQVLLLIALTGYMVLNRGFENLTIHAGIPIIVSYVVMFVCLALAIFSRPDWLTRVRQEPALMCLFALLVLTFLHLVFDIPAYGIWAFRDASMIFDGVFLILGLLWAMKGSSVIPLMKWLMVIFFLNLVYGLTLPWWEAISAWSPRSGVFLSVPLFGNYVGNPFWLLVGALFYLSLSRYVVRWPRWIILLLIMVQLFELTIHQARAMYVGFVVVLIIFVFLGESGKSKKLLFMLWPALAGVLLLTTIGIELPGRVGPVSLDFLKEHVRSLSGAEDTPGSKGRFGWYDEAFVHVRAHPVLGEGFGMVLIDFNDVDHPEHAAVRQPHNASLSILARLGAVGLIFWVAFHVYLWKAFIFAFRQRRYCDKFMVDLMVWLFMTYVLFMIEASVQAEFEFPSGSIPFYFFAGLALGLIRWQIPHKQREELPRAASAPELACNVS